MTWREDKTLIVLGFFAIFYTAVLLLVLWWKPNDGTVWTFFSALPNGFIGALMMHLKGDKAAPAGSVTDIDTRQRVVIPPIPPQETQEPKA